MDRQHALLMLEGTPGLSTAKGRGILSIERAGIRRISVENAGRLFCNMPWLTRCTDCPGSRAAPLRIAVSGAVASAALQIFARAALLLVLVVLLGASQADAEAGHLLDRLL